MLSIFFCTLHLTLFIIRATPTLIVLLIEYVIILVQFIEVPPFQIADAVGFRIKGVRGIKGVRVTDQPYISLISYPLPAPLAKLVFLLASLSAF